MSKLTVIAFMLGEKCQVTGEAIAFFPARYMTGEGNLYKDGELNNIGRTLEDEKVADVHNILHEICDYELGSNSYLPLNNEQLEKLSNAFEGTHPFCYDGIDEIQNADTFSPGILVLTSDENVSSAAEAYWKLSSISLREKSPLSYQLDGAFGQMENIAWMNDGTVVKASKAGIYQHKMRLSGKIIIATSVDKFPQMTRYFTVTDVRIADAIRVRLGAHVGTKTTVMHEGFINFDAGTSNHKTIPDKDNPGQMKDVGCMIEGRISNKVFVGAGSDFGGGCSTMGTMSGGGKEIVSIGEDTLIGANGGTGISLGNNCTIEAGLYITASAKLSIIDQNGNEQSKAKALELSGKDGYLFRRNSVTGAIEAKYKPNEVELNNALHANN